MKNLLYLLILPVMLSIFTCGKHLDCCTPAHPLLVTAQKNDANWTGSAFEAAGTSYQGTKISAASHNNNGVNDTLVMTINYADGQSNYKLSSGQVYYHSAANGVVKTYQLDTLATGNELNVTSYQMHWDFIEGTFNLKFINPGGSDISFTNGKFDVVIGN